MATLKPPNLLVILGDTKKHPGVEKRSRVTEQLMKCLQEDRYTVYDITLSEFTQSRWTESTQVLVIPSPTSGGPGKLSPRAIVHVKDFFLKGGKILSMHSQINRAFGFHLDSSTIGLSGSDIVTFTDETSREFFENFSDGNTAITCPLVFDKAPLSQDDPFPCDHCKREPLVSIPSGAGVIESVQDISSGDTVAILSYVDLCPDPCQYSDPAVFGRIVNTSDARKAVFRSSLKRLNLHLSKNAVLIYSLSYILSSNEKSELDLLDVIRKAGNTDRYTLEVVQRDKYGGIPVDCDPTDQKLCILPNPTEGELSGLKFNKDKYFKELTTKTLGHTLLYTPVIASTHLLYQRNIPLLFALGDKLGLVSIADRQTKGKGRQGNIWLSPEGCLVFSTSYSFSTSSVLNSCVGAQQHLPVTAVVHSIRSMEGCEDFDIRIKWPNDIYYGCKAKIGGGLVDIHVNENAVVIATGVGVNVTNAYPTLSLADCINLHNAANSTSLKPIPVEQLLARTLGALEALIDDMERVLPSGRMEDTLFMRLYYKYWLHSDTVQKATLKATGQRVTILSINSQGQLVVEDEEGEQIGLTGLLYSFDIVKGVISKK